MTIPPFPSQDLAKLVLGYLAEEQLMTAYDEFLQASPYLDALGNEYDRIFMTSLKNILAEYRAVKIYVETCKPFMLRKRLFQCSNLLEIVKFLIAYIDLTKLQDSSQNKCSSEKQNNIVSTIVCEVCNSLNLETCMCKSRHLTVSSIQSETRSTDNSLEATSLSDLPGNHAHRKKNVKVLEKDISINNINEPSELTGKTPSADGQDGNNLAPIVNSDSQTRVQGILFASYNFPVQTNKPLNSKQKEEFIKTQNQTCNKNLEIVNPASGIEKSGKNNLATGGYKDFTTGFNGGDNGNAIVPDSSTSENIQIQIPVSNNENLTPNTEKTRRKQTRTQYLLKLASHSGSSEVVSINTVTNGSIPRLKSKPDDSKIKILSDIKVDNSFNGNETTGNLKTPSVLKNATSTPLLQMQTIVINGTPVYKQRVPTQQQNYTKDEIMAMPTIILTPASGPPPFPVKMSTCTTTTQQRQQNQPYVISTTARQLGSLIIDVANSNPHLVVEKPNQAPASNEPNNQEEVKDPVPKTVDITSASAPKDITTSVTETSTPQVLPPVRKTSSTPRRSSHVRVLDFTTPRRILQETANKRVPSSPINDVEVVISKSHSLNALSIDTEITSNALLKENNMKSQILDKKKNWDADLRALAIIAEKSEEIDGTFNSKPKRKARTKKVSKKDIDKIGGEKPIKKRSTKTKLSKKCQELEVTEPISSCEKTEILVKPTINIIAGADRRSGSFDKEKSQNKSSNDHIDTPEMERISLQNEIGGKLNISDLLETPYKQALYDIQMETPRFLGPDIPDDPMSDIKIMNIPTPRFLTTAATPSSYSSRPTDYSSGGSYYKPDDQDYLRVGDDLTCPVSSTKDNQVAEIASNKKVDISNRKDEKPSRPVRQCTKNISYNVNSKLKDNSDKEVIETLSSDTENVDFNESNAIKGVSAKPKENKTKILNKSDVKKKNTTKKRKTPVKKEVPKSFMKIKPRRPTPTKSKDKRNRNSSDISVLTRKKVAYKEGGVSSTPMVAAPTKSRRKSSTPRKLHCNKTFNSESSGHTSPEQPLSKDKENIPETNMAVVQDSDTEQQLRLRWSDDGSQDVKPKEPQVIPNMVSEDIMQIKEYIETTLPNKSLNNDSEGSLHIDLVKRGFDLETAKIIERDLLDPSPQQNHEIPNSIIVTTAMEPDKIQIVSEAQIDNDNVNKSLESDCSATNLQIVQDDDEEEGDEVELSVHECCEDSANFLVCSHDDTKDLPKRELAKLKDKFSMEICLDDDFSVRLRATPLSLVLDLDPQTDKETELAVSSITNIEKLYTPMKESIKAQCYEIFDSTLTSLDTPLKTNSPKRQETQVTVTEIVLEVEKVEVKEKPDSKKRKRIQSGNLSDEGFNESKKAKPETQYLFNSANIQNIDIESVLSKLHGP